MKISTDTIQWIRVRIRTCTHSYRLKISTTSNSQRIKILRFTTFQSNQIKIILKFGAQGIAHHVNMKTGENKQTNGTIM